MASVLAPVTPPAPTLAALLKALVADSVNSRESKRAYSRALDHFFEWLEAKGARFTKATVQAYRAELVESGLAPLHREPAHDGDPASGCRSRRQPDA
jgi:hypothetical protein